MDYTIQQLIHNPSFRRWAKGQADPDDVSQWDRWTQASGEHRRKAKEATAEIVGFEFKDPECPDIAGEWERLKKTTIDKKKNRMNLPLDHYRSRHQRSRLRWLYRGAAALLLVTLTGIGLYFYSGSEQTPAHVTRITQSKTIKTGSSKQTTIAFSGGAKISWAVGRH